MLSKNKIKSFRSLEMKKNRDANDVFVAEGPKVVHDILSIHKELLSAIAATEEWFAQENKLTDDLTCEKITVSADELTKVSLLCHPQQVFAVFRKFKQITSDELPSLADKLTLVLDGVQDPGNLGTIIRIADWFGIEDIICSKETVDAYNPKVVQATMGILNLHSTGMCQTAALSIQFGLSIRSLSQYLSALGLHGNTLVMQSFELLSPLIDRSTKVSENDMRVLSSLEHLTHTYSLIENIRTLI